MITMAEEIACTASVPSLGAGLDLLLMPLRQVFQPFTERTELSML